MNAILSFFKNLFSWSFKGMISLQLLKLIYAIVLIMAIITAIPTMGLSLLGLLGLRLIFECILLFFKMNENLSEMNENMKKLICDKENKNI